MLPQAGPIIQVVPVQSALVVYKHNVTSVLETKQGQKIAKETYKQLE